MNPATAHGSGELETAGFRAENQTTAREGLDLFSSLTVGEWSRSWRTRMVEDGREKHKLQQREASGCVLGGEGEMGEVWEGQGLGRDA